MTVQSAINAEYLPHDDEPFMCDRQKAFFRQRLQELKREILDESRETVEAMQESAANISDLVDRASAEADRALELRTRDRQRKLIAKIDGALRRIETGEYGYCDETGEPISLRRLIARPTATLSLEAQERHERREKIHRDE